MGIASIKWLGDLEVATTKLFTPWNTLFYPEVTTQPVKSAFELPWNATVPLPGPHVVRGRSWSGQGRIVRVEVSLDGGTTWREALHHGAHLVKAWLPWHVNWAPRHTGPHVLMARATDETGTTQPSVTVGHPLGYHFDAVVRHPVRVVSG
ncbi:hypothetical protein [Nonomuraea maritima]|uniref:hypothetical protein n=1 Tax=Nonomuraea maritima TaxID=683260 RepID=UPI00371C0270